MRGVISVLKLSLIDKSGKYYNNTGKEHVIPYIQQTRPLYATAHNTLW